MPLTAYHKKRHFKETPEPRGTKKVSRGAAVFCIQKHAATRLHYDFRLEMGGVLKSWAVPKGPSFDPSVKRLAMMVEDHPYDYLRFEGEIPEGHYVAGEVIVWDIGTYTPVDENLDPITERAFMTSMKEGNMKFSLQGKKMKGLFALVKFRAAKNAWLLIKKRDAHASTKDVTRLITSAISKKRLANP